MRGLGRGLLGAAALIAGLTVLARVAGFVRGLAFTAGVGNATVVGEAYNAANTVPNVLFEVVAGGALAGAVVPLLAAPLGRGDQRGADRVVGALLGWTLLLLVPAAVAVAALAGPLSHLLRPGTELAEQRALVAVMLVVFAPQVVLYGLGVVLTGALQAQRRFAWPALAPLLSSLVVIGAYLLYARLDGPGGGGSGEGPGTAALAVLAGGTTLGVLVLTLPLLGPVLASGLRPRPTLRFPPGVLRRARSLAAAGLLALLAQQAAVLTALLLGGRLGDPVPGSFSVFVQVVQPVSFLPYAVLAVPLATSAFPRLADLAARGDVAGYARTASTSTRAVVLVALLGAALLVAVAPAVEVFYAEIDAGRAPTAPTGADVTAYAVVSAAVTAVAPSLLGLALVAHVARALYALERGRAAATATVAGWLVVVVAMVALAAALPGSARLVALAAGTSLGMTVAAALLLRALAVAAGPRALEGVGRTLVASTGAGLAGAVAGRLVVDALLGALGGTARAAVLAAAAGVVVAGLVVAAAVAVLDRRAAATASARLRGRTGGQRAGTRPAAAGDAPGRDEEQREGRGGRT